MTIRKTRFFIFVLIMSLVFGFGFASCEDKGDVENEAAPEQDSRVSAAAVSESAVSESAVGEKDDGLYGEYISAIDTGFAYDLAVEITEGAEYNSNSEFGDRTAGSDAEHATADRLARAMKDIGLDDIEKIAVPVDKWQFNGASLEVDGADKPILLHSYATSATPAEGISAPIVYVGKGTAADYEGLDVKGSIVLFDVDQRADWWVTSPMLEAEHQGAVAALACSNKGFSEISDEAYNSNDICGPTSIPTVSITVKDAEALKKIIKSNGAKGVKGLLKVDNIVEPGGGATYNVLGKIKGESSEQAILYGAHYDAYFRGFQDDTIAATGVLAIAKAFKDSGYTPKHDIWFVMHGSEEWGATNTQYDWCTGAWRLINEAHPEWQGKILSFFNFELPAYEFADYTYSTSSPEQFTMVKNFADAVDSPKPKGAFKDGIITDGYQTYTYSDDFSYYAAGVPSVINGFLIDVKSEEGEAFPFYYQYYHTNFDTKDTYNEDVFRFNLEYYGSMGIHVDSTPALELDYRADAERLRESIDADAAKANGVDIDAYMKAVDAYAKAADSAWARVEKLNNDYFGALASSVDENAPKVWAEGVNLNEENLKIFKRTQEAILGLMYERPIVPHEAYQENIALIDETVKALKKGEIAKAVDEYAWMINNVEEWYTMYFSPEVVDKTHDMFFSSDNADNLFWGSGRQFEWANVADAVRGITAKYDEKGADVSKEIGIFEKAAKAQAKLYADTVSDETKKIEELTSMLEDLAKQ